MQVQRNFQTTTNIPFKARINLYSKPQAFDALKKEIPKNNFVNKPWTFEDAVSNVTEACTEGLQICTSFVLSNKKKLTLDHINPTEDINTDFSKIEEHVDNQLKILGGKVTGFITGGYRNDQESLDFCNKLQDLFKRKNIPFSIAWGLDFIDNPDEFLKETHVISTIKKTFMQSMQDINICLKFRDYNRSHIPINSLEDAKDKFLFFNILPEDKARIV